MKTHILHSTKTIVAEAHFTLLNLNVGLTFDFYSHKNKRTTYDYYGMGDPYRDK